MAETTCRLLESSELSDSVELPPDLAAHVRDCLACSRTHARQLALVAFLESMPESPPLEVASPSLANESAPLPALLRMPAWAVTAAAAVLVAAIAGTLLRREAVSVSAPVHVGRAVDLPGDPPPSDERLLALTDGVEAVAMRRPTESR